MTWVSELTGQLDFYVTTGLLPRLAGLSDDEYLWRPVGDSWSIVLGDGGWRAEGGQPAPPTPPLTTIA